MPYVPVAPDGLCRQRLANDARRLTRVIVRAGHSVTATRLTADTTPAKMTTRRSMTGALSNTRLGMTASVMWSIG